MRFCKIHWKIAQIYILDDSFMSKQINSLWVKQILFDKNGQILLNKRFFKQKPNRFYRFINKGPDFRFSWEIEKISSSQTTGDSVKN